MTALWHGLCRFAGPLLIIAISSSCGFVIGVGLTMGALP